MTFNAFAMRIFTLITVTIFYLSNVYSQQPGSDRVKAAKVEYFTKKLQLTPAESKKFWPIYNDYQSRKSRLTNERKTLMRFYDENSQNMSPEEVSETLDKYIEIEQELATLLSQYNQKFKQVLADEKVLKIYVTEVQFRNYLLKQLRTRQKGIKPRN
jgi:hypothetical protein